MYTATAIVTSAQSVLGLDRSEFSRNTYFLSLSLSDSVHILLADAQCLRSKLNLSTENYLHFHF